MQEDVVGHVSNLANRLKMVSIKFPGMIRVDGRGGTVYLGIG